MNLFELETYLSSDESKAKIDKLVSFIEYSPNLLAAYNSGNTRARIFKRNSDTYMRSMVISFDDNGLVSQILSDNDTVVVNDAPQLNKSNYENLISQQDRIPWVKIGKLISEWAKTIDFNVTMEDLKYLSHYISIKSSGRQITSFVEDLKKFKYVAPDEQCPTLYVTPTMELRYNTKFILTTIIEDLVKSKFFGTREFEYTPIISFAYMIGHELLHYRLAHFNPEVTKAMNSYFIGMNSLKNQKNKKVFSDGLRSLRTIYQELDVNNAMSTIFSVLPCDSGMGLKQGGFEMTAKLSSDNKKIFLTTSYWNSAPGDWHDLKIRVKCDGFGILFFTSVHSILKCLVSDDLVTPPNPKPPKFEVGDLVNAKGDKDVIYVVTDIDSNGTVSVTEVPKDVVLGESFILSEGKIFKEDELDKYSPDEPDDDSEKQPGEDSEPDPDGDSGDDEEDGDDTEPGDGGSKPEPKDDTEPADEEPEDGDGSSKSEDPPVDEPKDNNEPAPNGETEEPGEPTGEEPKPGKPGDGEPEPTDEPGDGISTETHQGSIFDRLVKNAIGSNTKEVKKILGREDDDDEEISKIEPEDDELKSEIDGYDPRSSIENAIKNILNSDKENLFAGTTYEEEMALANKWFLKLKGTPREDVIYDTTLQSRRIKGLWGKDQDVEIPAKNKSLCILLDTSGSMNANFLLAICSDIVIKLMKSRIINKVFVIDHDGHGNNRYQQPSKIKKMMSAILTIGSGSSNLRARKQIEKVLAREKNSELSGILYITDLLIDESSFTLPTFVKYKVPLLLIANLNGGAVDKGDASRFMERNKVLYPTTVMMTEIGKKPYFLHNLINVK